MEDLSTVSLNPQVVIKEVQQVTTNVLGSPPPPPSNIPQAPLPKKSFKGSLTNLELLLDVKYKLLNRKQYRENEEGELVITDKPYLDEEQQKIFKEEIEKIHKQIDKLKDD